MRSVRGHHRLRQRRRAAARTTWEHLRLGRLPATRRRLRRVPAHLQRRAQRTGYLPERLPAADHHRHRRLGAGLGRARRAGRLGHRRRAWCTATTRSRYGVENSLNVSYGAASQTSFDAGGMKYDQLVFNAGVVRGFDWGLAEPVNVALGVEARRESYSIEAGEPASYNRGPVAGAAGRRAGLPGLPAQQRTRRGARSLRRLCRSRGAVHRTVPRVAPRCAPRTTRTSAAR